MLVGADGLRSVVRRAIAEASIRYAGYTARRGVSSVPVEPGRLTESWGVGERFGLVDIGRGQTYWFATKNASEGESDEPGGRKAEILRRFSGWHEPIAAIVDSADEAILRNDVYDLEAASALERGPHRLGRRRRARGDPRRRPGRGPGDGGCGRARRSARWRRRSYFRTRRVRRDPATARGSGPEDVPSRRQGRPARERTRVATQERRRPSTARTGSTPPARADRSLPAVRAAMHVGRSRVSPRLPSSPASARLAGLTGNPQLATRTPPCRCPDSGRSHATPWTRG